MVYCQTLKYTIHHKACNLLHCVNALYIGFKDLVTLVNNMGGFLTWGPIRGMKYDNLSDLQSKKVRTTDVHHLQKTISTFSP